ncbi:hypothetical protein V6N12_060039 [Hibiscus sabdariffa]|uniref:Uncharacterized protein n=1 Tax=Hibiscus sabdariffa TaxID=183260 RepID=A0ABR2D418_9ROSI
MIRYTDGIRVNALHRRFHVALVTINIRNIKILLESEKSKYPQLRDGRNGKKHSRVIRETAGLPSWFDNLEMTLDLQINNHKLGTEKFMVIKQGRVDERMNHTSSANLFTSVPPRPGPSTVSPLENYSRLRLSTPWTLLLLFS